MLIRIALVTLVALVAFGAFVESALWAGPQRWNGATSELFDCATGNLVVKVLELFAIAIVKRIAAFHGGEVRVHDEAGRRARMTVVLASASPSLRGGFTLLRCPCSLWHRRALPHEAPV